MVEPRIISIGGGSVIRLTTAVADESLHEGEFTVPNSIEQKEIWIVWRLEDNDGRKPSKVPKAPQFPDWGGLRSTDGTSRENATTFISANEFVRRSRQRLGENGANGVGLILSQDDDIVCIDLDDCYDAETGEVQQYAQDVVSLLDSYTEVSQSGTGLHVFYRGTLDENHQLRDDELGIEMYQQDRYIAFTGRHVEDTPSELRDRDNLGAEIQRSVMDEKSSNTDIESEPETSDPTVEELSRDDDSINADVTERCTKASSDVDDDTIEQCIEMASEYDSDFEELYHGRIPPKYNDDHSRADFALASKLAYWCDGDIQMMDEIFRRSELMREKWDEDRGDTTYGCRTLKKAIRKNPDRYGGDW